MSSQLERRSIEGGDLDVTLLRWPEEAAVRAALAVLGRPRLLLVEPGCQPPDSLDPLEDWLRWPPDPNELLVRALHLGGRPASATEAPAPFWLDDDDGVLRRGERWVAITDAQLPMLRLLLASLGRVVRFEALAEAYSAGGGSNHPASVRSNITRLKSRIRPLGLDLVTVRQRGVVLRDPTADVSASRQA